MLAAVAATSRHAASRDLESHCERVLLALRYAVCGCVRRRRRPMGPPARRGQCGGACSISFHIGLKARSSSTSISAASLSAEAFQLTRQGRADELGQFLEKEFGTAR